MSDFLEDLKRYFDTTPPEKVKANWEKSKEYDNIGPTVYEFLKMQNRNKMKVEWFYTGEDIQIQIRKEDSDYSFDLQTFFEELGDLITCNEVNPNKDTIWLCYNGMVYELYPEDMDRGDVFRAYYIGELVDLLDYSKKSHLDFGKWYWSVDSVEEFPK